MLILGVATDPSHHPRSTIRPFPRSPTFLFLNNSVSSWLRTVRQVCVSIKRIQAPLFCSGNRASEFRFFGSNDDVYVCPCWAEDGSVDPRYARGECTCIPAGFRTFHFRPAESLESPRLSPRLPWFSRRDGQSRRLIRCWWWWARENVVDASRAWSHRRGEIRSLARPRSFPLFSVLRPIRAMSPGWWLLVRGPLLLAEGWAVATSR